MRRMSGLIGISDQISLITITNLINRESALRILPGSTYMGFNKFNQAPKQELPNVADRL
jgi:hypothetical protein